jgi:hypothetical protein
MKTMIGVVLLAVAANVQAIEQHENNELFESCTQKGNIAYSIATLRDSGVRIEEAIGLIKDDENPQFVDDLPLIYTSSKYAGMSPAHVAEDFYQTCLTGKYSNFVAVL